MEEKEERWLIKLLEFLEGEISLEEEMRLYEEYRKINTEVSWEEFQKLNEKLREEWKKYKKKKFH